MKAQFDLDNTRITAPIAGLIERTRVYEGRLVSVQTDLLTIIHRVDPMYVTVSVPEPFLLKRLHSPEGDLVIFFPNEKVMMAVDFIAPGWVPLLDFDITGNMFVYLGATASSHTSLMHSSLDTPLTADDARMSS